jgi:hypothetical protein
MSKNSFTNSIVRNDDSNKSYLTDNVSSKSLRRWTLNEFNIYMYFAIIMSSLPMPSQFNSLIININNKISDDSIIFIFIDFFGCCVLVYRVFCIFILLYKRKLLTPARVEYTIKVIWFGFYFYLLKVLFILILPNFAQDSFIFSLSIKAEQWVVAVLYVLVNVLLTVPDIYIMYKLNFYLTYNFDDDDDIDDVIDFTTDIRIFSHSRSKTSLNSNIGGINLL